MQAKPAMCSPFFGARKQAGAGPLFLIGFSLGGNVVLKLAGESAAGGKHSAGRRVRRVHSHRPGHVRARHRPQAKFHLSAVDSSSPSRTASAAAISRRPKSTRWNICPRSAASSISTTTTPSRLFGFGTAANYFRTQSCGQFLDRIRIPALLITAKDDPLVPFEIYSHPAFATNPNLRLVTPEHGGHLGFLARHRPRFWLDTVVLDWMESLRAAHRSCWPAYGLRLKRGSRKDQPPHTNRTNLRSIRVS